MNNNEDCKIEKLFKPQNFFEHVESDPEILDTKERETRARKTTNNDTHHNLMHKHKAKYPSESGKQTQNIEMTSVGQKLYSHENYKPTSNNTTKEELSDIDLKTIAFTEDLLIRIENLQYTKNYIDEEIKTLAKSIKSRINFHHIIQQYYISNTDNFTNNSFYLVNILLKFIHDNYNVSKYYQNFIFLIELFTYIIEVKADILGGEINHFQKNIDTLDNIIFKYCQGLFLYNNSIEIFLKSVCENNYIFNQSVFPSVLKFFNMLLQGNNSNIQNKFFDLFNYFVNSENLFYYIKGVFSSDIYIQTNDESEIINRKNNISRKNFIVSLLKFIQNLAQGKDLQTYLREQAKNRISYNFVYILVDYINMLLSKMVVLYEHKELDEETLHLYYPRLIASIEAIYELLQGPCTKNQEALVNTKIIEIFDKILREIVFDSKFKKHLNSDDGDEEVFNLFYSLKLLIIMSVRFLK